MSDDLTDTVKEVAKTTEKAIDAANKFGGFISKYISGSLEQAMGIFEDKLKYMRWERQVRLMIKAEEYMKKINMENPTKPIKLKLAIPLLEAASLEDDDYLQDLWAKLLVNSANDSSGIDLKRTYIDILEQLTSFEVRILEKIYSLPFEKTQHLGVLTSYLPNKVEIAKKGDKEKHPNPNEDVILVLANLSRLGCISPSYSWGGGEIFTSVNTTVLGKYFIKACTLNFSK